MDASTVSETVIVALFVSLIDWLTVRIIVFAADEDVVILADLDTVLTTEGVLER